MIYIGKTIYSEEKINDDSPAYFSEEHIRKTVFAHLLELNEFAQSSYGINIAAGTITENIMKKLKGGNNA
ncbi:MAG: hypothetical protein IKJ78_06025 [Bacteroidales bacterium]|nr:hypothetical protein [Bacteroidales bacterium]